MKHLQEFNAEVSITSMDAFDSMYAAVRFEHKQRKYLTLLHMYLALPGRIPLRPLILSLVLASGPVFHMIKFGSL